ncbi:unnamed protein product [Didymodactylos carnosus]|uniref:BZIP domain-containing protein n=1 Tax=Didymodactylos carnosus TaxID=1234261 RepID=A0A813U784_9BILA|nr:unnamed protein product [Didymodactylos carnosus]CAF1142379.1 unnamed protein product [Didymodactylos carnosus]CAF3605690.1 unnamed protein product [Didymodactylos carnosus]CAF3939726.1 unnamed protein product [Didymodactylos carnosus]
MSLNEDLSPCALNTPSLPMSTTIIQHNPLSEAGTSYISSTTTTRTMTTLITVPNSFENPLIKIKNDLKQSFREPTTSPFQSILSSKTPTTIIRKEDVSEASPGILIPPSTAEVMSVIESIQGTKPSKTEATNLTESTQLHELTSIPDSSLSPKKKILLRSQSENELTATSAVLQADHQQFLSITDKPHEEENLTTESKLHASVMVNNTHNNTNNHASIQNVHHDFTSDASQTQSGNKYIQIVFNNQLHTFHLDQYGQPHDELPTTNKRTFQQTNMNNDETVSVIVQNQQNMSNEVTSSDQPFHQAKRSKVATAAAAAGTNGLRSYQTHTITPATTNSYQQQQQQSPPIAQPTVSGVAIGESDVRRRQIRDSNREAARRCRERRRQYIETLETNLEQQKQQNQKLELDIQHLKRENIQLKTILSETTITKLSKSSS